MERFLTTEIFRQALIQAGLVSWHQLGCPSHRVLSLQRKGVLKRVIRNVYSVTSIVPEESRLVDGSIHKWRRLRAAWAGLLSTPNAIATGQAALALHEVWGLPTRIQPEITTPKMTHTKGVTGVRVRQFQQPFALSVHAGRKIAAPIPALAQALPELGLQRGVAVVDSALNQGLVQPEDLVEIRTLMRWRKGVRGLGRWWELVDGRAQSPVESEARLACWRADLPVPQLQVPIKNKQGKVFARADLGWLRPDGVWVLAEIDGKEFHDTPSAAFQDRHRQNQIMQEGGYRLLRFTGKDIRDGRFVREIARVLRVSAELPSAKFRRA